MGFEADFLNRRLHVDYTRYDKRTKDALIALPIPASVGASVLSLQQNLGKTRNWGNELSATAVLIDRRSWGWDMTFGASHNDNKWLDLGKDSSKCTTTNGQLTCADLVIGAGLTTQQHRGDPLNMQWYRGYTYNDANGDGIIQVAEVKVDSALSKIAVGFAKDVVSIQNGFDLLNRRLRI